MIPHPKTLLILQMFLAAFNTAQFVSHHHPVSAALAVFCSLFVLVMAIEGAAK